MNETAFYILCACVVCAYEKNHLSPDYDSYARHLHAKGGAGSRLLLRDSSKRCPASSLKDREMRCYPSDVWTPLAWAVCGITKLSAAP